MTERRRFKVRACPVCHEVQMPHYRDPVYYCRNSGVREDAPYKGHKERVRLAWFDVEEADTPTNEANEQARQEGTRDEFSTINGRLFRRNPFTGESGFVGSGRPVAHG